MKPSSLSSIPNSIQTNWQLCEVKGTKVFAFLQSYDADWRLKSFRPAEKVEFSSIYHHIKFEPNPFINIRMHANDEVFF